MSSPAGNPSSQDLFGQVPFNTSNLLPSATHNVKQTLPTSSATSPTVDHDRDAGHVVDPNRSNHRGLDDVGADQDQVHEQDVSGTAKKKKFLYTRFSKDDLKPFPVRASPRISKPSTRYPDTVYYK